MSAPGLRATESAMSCTRPAAASASTALPMRASWNMERTATLDWLQILAARCSSACVLLGRRSRWGGGGGAGSVSLNGGRSASWPKSVWMRSSTSSGESAGRPRATSLPRSVSIHTSCTEVARMRSRSLGSLSTNFVRQKGWSIHEPQNSCRYMPRVRSST